MTSNSDYLGFVYHGQECYSSAMDNSRKVLRAFTANVLQCFNDMLISEGSSSRSICIAEFGSADGGVSLELMDALIDNLDKMSEGQREVLLVYEDQLLNDYNVLFKTVHDSNISTKLSRRDKCHLLTSATTMYRKCLPTGFVDLSFLSMATGWLSQRPCHIRGGIFQTDCNSVELEAYRRQWQSDWKQFLSCRAQELRPGGYLVVISFVMGDSGRYNETGGEDYHDMFTNTWRSFWHSGKITEEEFVSSTKITYTPTQSELEQPFNTDMKQYLTLVDSIQRDVKIIPGLTNDTGTKERQNVLDGHLRCTKPWLYNILKGGLSPDRTEADKDALLEEYFQTIYKVLVQKTTFDPLFYKTACVIARRTHV
ncbi:probable S-adenosylmethionine-dependent methyltransferase At5g38100 [Pecten maximus]|uniref:probable S-adenosylmethionine-dependent methyltransferase At5g38100 n=1 Tax=Pecten maximus TaxID=6579 RepID=UPI00145894E2|nr:probable S-adenosylmethionine-dependent methyltransferase At5g38100 [Pecten maximus]